MKWIYKDDFYDNVDVSKLYGFIYKLEFEYNEDIYTYYGKKNFNSIVELDALKNGNKREGHVRFQGRNKNGKRIQREIIARESNWKTYTSSSKDVKIDSMILISKEILHIVPIEDGCKQTLSYMEDYYLMVKEVLFDEYNLNKNIAGRYFAGKIIGSKEWKEN